jgi:hypothetical protein
MYRLGIEYINAFAVIGLCCCDWIDTRASEQRKEQHILKESVHKVCPLSISLSSFNGLDLGKE